MSNQECAPLTIGEASWGFGVRPGQQGLGQGQSHREKQQSHRHRAKPTRSGAAGPERWGNALAPGLRSLTRCEPQRCHADVVAVTSLHAIRQRKEDTSRRSPLSTMVRLNKTGSRGRLAVLAGPPPAHRQFALLCRTPATATRS